jgi:hypothetical protein
MGIVYGSGVHGYEIMSSAVCIFIDIHSRFMYIELGAA